MKAFLGTKIVKRLHFSSKTNFNHQLTKNLRMRMNKTFKYTILRILILTSNHNNKLKINQQFSETDKTKLTKK